MGIRRFRCVIGKQSNGSWTIGNYAVALSGCSRLILGRLMRRVSSLRFEGNRILVGDRQMMKREEDQELRDLGDGRIILFGTEAPK